MRRHERCFPSATRGAGESGDTSQHSKCTNSTVSRPANKEDFFRSGESEAYAWEDSIHFRSPEQIALSTITLSGSSPA